MTQLVKMKFGSHLYGTSSESSDTDYKSVYLPEVKDCLLDRIVKNITTSTGGSGKNTADDEDEEIFSLQFFMHLAHKGEMLVIDMIHAPDDMIIQSSYIWDTIRENRKLFYSKNMNGYLGYIRKQTAKYSIKGDRLAAMSDVLKVLNSVEKPSITKLTEIWDSLPTNKYAMFVDLPQEERWRMYEVAGKRVQETATVEYTANIIQMHYDRYGARAKQAEDNSGVDWKAVSHAFRAAFQLKEMLETDNLIYPLKDAQFIKDVKYGKFHYQNDKIGEQLDNLLDEIGELILKSDWPDTVNQSKLDQLVLNAYNH